MAKSLKFWNGRAYGVLPAPLWKRGSDSAHVFACAHSVADLQRLCTELGLYPVPTNEVRTYWSPCWGLAMDGIEPERGIWVAYGYSEKPKRLTALHKEAE